MRGYFLTVNDKLAMMLPSAKLPSPTPVLVILPICKYGVGDLVASSDVV